MRLAWNKGQGKAHADYAGRRFGRLTALRKGDLGSHVKWWCRCDCGTEKQASIYSLLRGGTVSCGCENRARLGREKRTHGKSLSREFVIWAGIMHRCYKASAAAYKDYGGRGICVDRRWHKFESFYEDMGDRPSPKHSIDRIDNDGPYSQENCRWATPTTQNRNSRQARIFEIDGEKRCISEWLELNGISYSRFKARRKKGWPEIKAMTTPVGARA